MHVLITQTARSTNIRGRLIMASAEHQPALLFRLCVSVCAFVGMSTATVGMSSCHADVDYSDHCPCSCLVSGIAS